MANIRRDHTRLPHDSHTLHLSKEERVFSTLLCYFQCEAHRLRGLEGRPGDHPSISMPSAHFPGKCRHSPRSRGHGQNPIFLGREGDGDTPFLGFGGFHLTELLKMRSLHVAPCKHVKEVATDPRDPGGWTGAFLQAVSAFIDSWFMTYGLIFVSILSILAKSFF